LEYVENNIKMDLKEIGCDVVTWIHLAQDRGQWWALVNYNEPSGSIKCREYLEWLNNYELLRKDRQTV
jgi:hypothetical protein